MKKLTLSRVVWAMLILLAFSCKKDEETVVVSAEALNTNKWIKENMEVFYLWNNRLPGIDETQEPDPTEYFDKLLYTTEDKWSWITDDYASLAAEYAGTPVTYGVDATPMYTSSAQTSICFVVNFVYSGSAAEVAGLKRGDIILNLNGSAITLDNYMTFYSSTTMTVQLADLSGGSLVLNGTSYSLTAKVTTTDPAIYHKVLENGGKKIGYLVYVEFVAGTRNAFLYQLDDIFQEFKSEGITDLVVDLRYNPGGEIGTAAYLASAIAPVNVVANKEKLVKLNYNTDYQAWLEQNYPDELYYNLTDTTTNLNLSKVYFLTTGGTASASELIICGLEPYMGVVQIGEPTYGKYTGMYVIADDNEEWCMLPVVMKYSNVEGFTDFVEGLEPDYSVTDYPQLGYQFGDTDDPMLAKAISLITGTVTATASAKSTGASLLQRASLAKPGDIKRNLFVPLPTGIQQAQ